MYEKNITHSITFRLTRFTTRPYMLVHTSNVPYDTLEFIRIYRIINDRTEYYTHIPSESLTELSWSLAYSLRKPTYWNLDKFSENLFYLESMTLGNFIEVQQMTYVNTYKTFLLPIIL